MTDPVHLVDAERDRSPHVLSHWERQKKLKDKNNKCGGCGTLLEGEVVDVYVYERLYTTVCRKRCAVNWVLDVLGDTPCSVSGCEERRHIPLVPWCWEHAPRFLYKERISEERCRAREGPDLYDSVWLGVDDVIDFEDRVGSFYALAFDAPIPGYDFIHPNPVPILVFRERYEARNSGAAT